MTARPALQARRSGRGRSAKPTPIRLMIVDDSSVARAVLSRMVAVASRLRGRRHRRQRRRGARRARRASRSTSSCSTSRCPAAAASRRCPTSSPPGSGARVLIVSSVPTTGAESTVRALAAGAADTLPKPGSGMFGGRFSEVLADALRRIGRVGAPSRESEAPAGARRRSSAARSCTTCRPAASRSAPRPAAFMPSTNSCGALPKPIGAPILVTQHLPRLVHASFRPPARTRRRAATARVAAGRRPARAGRRSMSRPATPISASSGAAATVRVRLDTQARAVGLPAFGRSDAGFGGRSLRRAAASASC